MASESWPSWLPNPKAGYQPKGVDPVLRNTMERGDKARNQFSAPLFDVQFQVRIPKGKFKYFQSWHVYKINNGADWFNMSVMTGDSTTTEEVRFKRFYEFVQEVNGPYIVTMDLEIRSNSLPNETQLDAWIAAL